MNYRKNKKFADSYNSIISLENLLDAWKSFQRGKKNKKDVQMFEYHLLDNLLNLHTDLKNKTYTHGGYKAFKVNDPKPRDIHKATVRDRVLHHALYQALTPFYFSLFISDSYSCQDEKGTHRALKRFQSFGNQVSKNHTKWFNTLESPILDSKPMYTTNPHLPRLRMQMVRLVKQSLWSTRKVARYSGFSQGVIVKWCQKDREYGMRIIPTLSSRPKNHPHALKEEVVEKIVAVRKKRKVC